jgi:hypothetical protein
VGAFFGSVQVRGCTREEVREAAERVARAHGIRCLIGPEIDGWIGVYPERQGQDQRVGEALAALLSGDVLHLLLHDEDVVAYWLWRDSLLLDSFFSRPGYFGDADRAAEDAMRGRPEALSGVNSAAAEILRPLLARDAEIDAMDRFERLAEALGIANAATSYEYMKAGETLGIRGWEQFTEVPAVVVSAERAAQRALGDLKKAKKRDGLLLAEARSKMWAFSAVAAARGFVVAAPLGRQRLYEFVHYAPPWHKAERLPIPPSECCSMGSDATGLRLAVGGQEKLAVYATDDWRQLLSSPAGIGNAVSLDRAGRLLVYAHRDGLTSGVACDGTFDAAGEHLLFGEYPNSGIAIAPARNPEDKRHLALDPLPDIAIPVPERTRQWAQRLLAERPRRERLAGRPGQLERMQAIARGRAAGMDRSETVAGFGFSADGRWVWMRTSYALRVYDWASVLAARGQLPKAAHVCVTAIVGEGGLDEGGVNAVAEDARSGAVLFGGWSGELRRLHIESGRVERLDGLLEADPPQGIVSIVLSTDGEALGLVLRARPSARDPRTLRDNRYWWQVWAYGKLVAKPA